MTIAWLASIAILAQTAPRMPPPSRFGRPSDGSLVIVGGGQLGPEIVGRFVDLAGGPDAEVVVIPTATETDPVDAKRAGERFARAFGFKNVTVLHTRDRAEADTEEFVAPLKKARAVWFDGGRQWRLVDSYLGTRTQREIEAVLARGGVIGGTSAGATIQGSYLVRGAREGNHIMMAKGYEEGFGYLRGRGDRPAHPPPEPRRTTSSRSSRPTPSCSASGSTRRPPSSSRATASRSSAGAWSGSTTARTTTASGITSSPPASGSTSRPAAGSSRTLGPHSPDPDPPGLLDKSRHPARFRGPNCRAWPIRLC